EQPQPVNVEPAKPESVVPEQPQPVNAESAKPEISASDLSAHGEYYAAALRDASNNHEHLSDQELMDRIHEIEFANANNGFKGIHTEHPEDIYREALKNHENINIPQNIADYALNLDNDLLADVVSDAKENNEHISPWQAMYRTTEIQEYGSLHPDIKNNHELINSFRDSLREPAKPESVVPEQPQPVNVEPAKPESVAPEQPQPVNVEPAKPEFPPEIQSKIDKVKNFVDKFNEFKENPTDDALASELNKIAKNYHFKQINVNDLPENIGLPTSKELSDMRHAIHNDSVFKNLHEQQFVFNANNYNFEIKNLLADIKDIVRNPNDGNAIDSISQTLFDDNFYNILNSHYDELKELHHDLPSLDNLHHLKKAVYFSSETGNELSNVIGRDLLSDTIKDIQSHGSDDYTPAHIDTNSLNQTDNVRRFVDTFNEYKDHADNQYLLEKLNEIIDNGQIDIQNYSEIVSENGDLPSHQELQLMKQIVRDSNNYHILHENISSFDPHSLEEQISKLTDNINSISNNVTDQHAANAIQSLLNDQQFYDTLIQQHHALEKAFPNLPSVENLKDLNEATYLINDDDKLTNDIGRKMLSSTIEHIKSSNITPTSIEHDLDKPDDPMSKATTPKPRL
ncbi:hypothetical protein ACPV4I_20400, partial [Photobacterium damselae]